MVPRGVLIGGFIILELAFIGQGLASHQNDPHDSWFPHWNIEQSAFGPRAVKDGPNLKEGGPPRTFYAGTHPTLTVDIGYADLTIRTSSDVRLDVSVAPSHAFGMFRTTTPITAHEDGQAVQIAKADDDGWSMGDDRMVTVVVPPDTQVTVASAGNITVDGLRAPASITAAGRGSVTVEDFNASSLDVKASHKIILDRVVATRVDVTSTDSRVEGTDLQVRDGRIESDGPMSLRFAPGADTVVSANPGDGKVSVSGPVTVTSDAGSKSDDDDTSRTVRIGAGNGHLDARANDDDIALSQGT
jgi:hypothetical protein